MPNWILIRFGWFVDNKNSCHSRIQNSISSWSSSTPPNYCPTLTNQSTQRHIHFTLCLAQTVRPNTRPSEPENGQWRAKWACLSSWEWWGRGFTQINPHWSASEQPWKPPVLQNSPKYSGSGYWHQGTTARNNWQNVPGGAQKVLSGCRGKSETAL